MFTPTTAILVGTVALIVFGPKQLPELAKSLGKAMGEFKKGLNGEPDPAAPPQVVTTSAIPGAPVAAPPAAAPPLVVPQPSTPAVGTDAGWAHPAPPAASAESGPSQG